MHNTKEIYVRDAQGNTIALYEIRKDSLYLSELYMYGSQRLGYLKENTFMGKLCKNKFCATINNPLPFNPNTSTAKLFNPVPLPVIPAFGSVSTYTPIYYGNKRYELNDWLGNVRVVINDRKTPVNTGSVTVSYKPQVTSVSDYYAFGSQISERSYDPVKPLYRFGFNTQEKVNEISPDHYTAKYWEYDSRLGRRWNVDPKPTVGESEYAVNKNNPIQNNDPEGDCANCPKPQFGANVKIGITLGKHNSIRGNLTLSAGLSGENYQVRLDASAGAYGGGLGTSKMGSKFGFDVTGGIIGTVGFGEGGELPQYSLNSETRSGLSNSFKASVSWGQMINFNSALGESTRIGLFGFRAGGVSVNSTNDVGQFPYFGGGTDHGWTGGIIASWNTKHGLMETGYESFTGKRPIKSFSSSNEPIYDIILINNRAYYNQNDYQRSLNRASTFIRLPGLNNYNINISNRGWLQDFIHDHQRANFSPDRKTPRFDYSRN